MKIVNNWYDIIQYSLLPPSCILCGHQGMQHMDLCQYCYNGLLTFNTFAKLKRNLNAR